MVRGGYYPGSGLMENLEAGFNRRLRGQQHEDQLQNSALRRMLDMNQEQRTAAMHPLEMEGKSLSNVGQGITNERSQQVIRHADAKEGRDVEDHHIKQQKEIIDSLGAVSGEIQAVPDDFKMDYINRRLGATEPGRNIIRALTEGMRAQQFGPKDLSKVLSDINKAALQHNPQYRGTMDAAQVRADASTQNALVAAERARDIANIRANSAAEVGVIRADAARQIAETKAKLTIEENERKRKHEMAKLERMYELRGKLAAEMAKEKGKQDPKTFEALAAKLENEANQTEDETRKAELQQLADDAFNRAATLRAAGKEQTDSVIVDKPGGGKTISQQGRIPSAPPRTGSSIKGTGQFEGFTITPKK